MNYEKIVAAAFLIVVVCMAIASVTVTSVMVFSTLGGCP
jgi:hypothetical protein